MVDVDGVLSDASRRQHLLAGEVRAWDRFFEASVTDPPIPEGIRLVEHLVGGRTTILLTARPARLVGTTTAWLDRHGVEWDMLVMRADGDHPTSPALKAPPQAGLRADGHQVELAVDDDPRNAEMYQSAGVPTVYLHSGYYDL
ncbi:MAG: hypothetical protein VX243_04320 [Actinomycetota bacterium]|nr:hypothetical protein [Actinomycetota bacterium]